jgi:F-type H+-transporting ATPase subunit delta
MSSRVAARYSKSLFELAVSQQRDELVYTEMNDLISIISGSPDLASLFRNPIVSASDKRKVSTEVFKDFSESSKNFINLVIAKKREDELSEMAASYIRQYDAVNGLAKATVRSAIPLNENTLSKVRKYLQGAIGMENVQLENIIDASVIGGMVIRYEDRLLDLSVSKELQEIRKQLIYN